jgi:hypothetical protein
MPALGGLTTGAKTSISQNRVAWFASSRAAAERAAMIESQDPVAFAKLFDAKLIGRAAPGLTVFIVSFDHSPIVEVRPQGEIESIWVPKESLDAYPWKNLAAMPAVPPPVLKLADVLRVWCEGLEQSDGIAKEFDTRFGQFLSAVNQNATMQAIKHLSPEVKAAFADMLVNGAAESDLAQAAHATGGSMRSDDAALQRFLGSADDFLRILAASYADGPPTASTQPIVPRQ